MAENTSIEEHLSKMFCESFLRNRGLSKLEISKIQYGLSIILINLVKIVQLYLVSALLGVVFETLITHIAFLIVRRYSYGFHWKSSFLCSLYGTILFSIVPFILNRNQYSIGIVTGMFVSICCVITVAILAPQATSKSIVRNKQTLRLKATISSIGLVVLASFNTVQPIRIYLVYGLVLVSSLLVINKFHVERSQKNVKEI